VHQYLLTIDGLTVVPGAGLNSRMNNGFSWIWGIVFVPHKKFHFGVSRAQQVLSGNEGQIVGYCWPFQSTELQCHANGCQRYKAL